MGYYLTDTRTDVLILSLTHKFRTKSLEQQLLTLWDLVKIRTLDVLRPNLPMVSVDKVFYLRTNQMAYIISIDNVITVWSKISGIPVLEALRSFYFSYATNKDYVKDLTKLLKLRLHVDVIANAFDLSLNWGKLV